MNPGTESVIRKQVSPQQLELLYNFFTEHLDLAKGTVNKHNVKQRLWDECAKLLNSVPNGSTRDGRGWSKWWSDWKYRTKARSSDIKTAMDMQTTEPICPLSEFEEKMLNLIGHNSADEEMVQDPLSEEDAEVSESYVTEKSKSRRRLKRERSVSPESNYFAELCSAEGPSSPPDRKPRLVTASSLDTPSDRETLAFLKLEEQKVKATNRIADSVENLTTEVGRMTHSLNQIIDLFRAFINNRTPHPG